MNTTDTSPIFLILSHQALVAQDIAEAVRDEVAGARVVAAHNLVGAMAMLEDVSKVDVAFVEASDLMQAASPGAEGPETFAARIILIGSEQATRWETLPVPFTSQDIARVLQCAKPSSRNEDEGQPVA